MAALATGAWAQDPSNQMPNYYSEPGLNPNRDYANQHFGEHIDPFTGKLQQHYVDVFLPGDGGFDLKVQRSYTSVEENAFDQTSPVGLGWTMHFGRVISVTSLCSELQEASTRKAPVLELPDGSRQLFALWTEAPATLVSASRWRMICNGSNGYTATSPEGTTYVFNKMWSTAVAGVTQWWVTQIVDKNGNSMTVTYDDGPLGPVVKTVEASDGRRVTFTNVLGPNGTYRLQSITTNTTPPQTYTYTQTTDPSKDSINFFLTQVDRPTGDSWRYEYNYSGGNPTPPGRYAMRLVTYPQGGSINYQYAFVNQMSASFRTTVVSAKTTSDGSWAFSYLPASVPGQFDTTTIDAPNSQQYVYKHIGFGSVAAGQVWSIGVLTQKTLKTMGVTTQTEDYNWGNQVISNQANRRPQQYLSTATILDSNYSVPILLSKTITRDGTSYTTNYSSFDLHGNPGVISEPGAQVETGPMPRSISRTYCVNTTQWILHAPANEIISQNGAQIGTIARTYDAPCANMLSESRFGVTTSYSYFQNGNVQTKTDARGAPFTTTYSDYAFGIPRTEAQPNSVTIHRIVSAAGNVVSETNGEGAATGYTFDALNRLTAIDHPTGNDVSVGWTSTTRTLTRGGFRHVQTLDGYGRVIQVSAGPVNAANGPNIVKIFRYNAVGQKTFESAPGSGAASAAGMQYTYDVLDRPTSIVHLNTLGASAATRSFAYASGNAVTITDERSNATRYSYLSFGNPDERYLTRIAPPTATGALTNIGRNALGQITSVAQGTNGVGTGVVTRTYGYDTHFFLTSIVDPETGTTSMGRDIVGNMTSRRVGTSGQTNFTYDGHNRLTSVSYPDPSRNVTQAWNRNHKLVSASMAGSTRTWQYDANNNMTREDLTVGGNTFSLLYAYDGNDQLSQITYPTSSTGETTPPKNVVTYSPDVFGRPTAVAPFVTGVTHFPNGQVNTITHASGVTTTIDQDVRLRPFHVTTSKPSTSAYIALAYAYDLGNNITGMTDTANSNNTRTLTYDAIDRLSSITTAGASYTLSYDGTGNLLLQNFGGSINYIYDSQNRLASTTGRSYVFSYDTYGNVTGNGTTTFQYDDASNLMCVNCASSNKVEYDYDGKGMRILTRKNGVTKYSMYGANGLLMFEYEPSANRFTQHVYLKGLRVATRALTVPFASATSLAASAGQVRPGQSVVLTATVSGNNPTGTITFFQDGVSIGSVPLAGGTATLTASNLVFGLHNFTASYGGDANNAVSATGAPVPVMVGTNSTTSMTASAMQVSSGQTVTLTAIVSGDSPTGTVTFTDGGASIGTVAIVNGTATLTTAPLLIGVHAFRATYGGDVNNSASSTPDTSVTAGTTSLTTLVASAAKVPAGQGVVLTVSVSGQTPTGTVNIFHNGVLAGGALIGNGTAQFTMSALPFGIHTFTASYAGDANNFPSTSNSVQVMAGDVDVLMIILNLLVMGN